MCKLGNHAILTNLAEAHTIHELYMQVDLKHMHQEPGNNVVTMGIDLTEFYLSVE